jgi:hypothetical protein
VLFAAKHGGDLWVPYNYRIPATSDWPAELQGVKLGHLANRIRNQGLFADRRAELLRLGFPYQSRTKYGWERVSTALLAYRDHFGDLNVPYKFQVPSTADWPVSVWGMKLGVVAVRIRARIIYKTMQSELMSIGFEFASQRRGRRLKKTLTATASKSFTIATFNSTNSGGM